MGSFHVALLEALVSAGVSSERARAVVDLLDRSIELGVVASYALLAAPYATPPLRRMLNIAPPRLVEAAVIIGFSILPVALRLLKGADARALSTQSPGAEGVGNA